MFHWILDPVRAAVSGARAFHYVAGVCRYHRIQASPGFRAAAHHCRDELEAAGVRAEVLTYPARSDVQYWSRQMFQEWECTLAELELVSPRRERLAWYDEDRIAVIQRSSATPPGGIEAEVVLVEPSDRPEAYAGLELEGKLVLADGDLERTRRLAVEQRGAVGIITDRLTEFPPVRHRMDLPDARQYTSFWWGPDQRRCFGFVLSPKAGEGLRRLIKDEKRREPVRVRAQVEARFYDGEIEVVSGYIPGETAEEVVVVAHLCHPQPSANDNASGAGALLEVARCLQKLIGAGTLPRPQRGIRFLLVPEMTGTYCFLASHEHLIPDMVAAVNLDMVGQHQELCGSTLLVENPARSTPSFAGTVLARVLEALADDTHNLARNTSYGRFRWAVTPYSGGSDHYIFSDPTVDVPCPMVIQWPDRYYHTNADTLERVDPFMLEKVAALVATYAYFLAQAGHAEAVWLAQELAAEFGGELHAAAARGLDRALTRGGGADLGTAWQDFDRQVQFLLERKLADIRSVRRLVPAAERGRLEPVVEVLAGQLAAAAAAERSRLRLTARALGATPAAVAAATVAPGRELVLRRRFRGPVSLRDHLPRLDAGARREWEEFLSTNRAATAMLTPALYWMDGCRSLAQVADLVKLETGSADGQVLARLAELLLALELVDVVPQ